MVWDGVGGCIIHRVQYDLEAMIQQGKLGNGKELIL